MAPDEARRTLVGEGVRRRALGDTIPAGIMGLRAAGGATTMHWSADEAVSGTLAVLGARLLSSAAQTITAQFVTCPHGTLEVASA